MKRILSILFSILSFDRDRLTPLLLLAATLCLVGAGTGKDWLPGQQQLVPVALVALIAGYGIGHLSLSVSLSWSLGSLVGAGLSINAASRLWGSDGRGGLDKLGLFAQNALRWAQSVASGQVVPGDAVTLFIVGLMTWMTVFYAAWAVARGHNALRATLPMGALIGLSVYYSFDSGLLYFILFLACVIVLLAYSELRQREIRWEVARLDYPGDLAFDVGLNVGGVAVILTVLALVASAITAPDVSDLAWQVAGEPIQGINHTLRQIFGEVSLPRQQKTISAKRRDLFTAGDASGITGLPRAHLLRGAAELHQQVVMRVRTDDPPPVYYDSLDEPPRQAVKRYWRAGVYDLYTGQGWVSAYETERQVGSETLLQAAPDVVFDPLWQRYALSSPSNVLYAVNTPVQVEAGVEASKELVARWRGDDLFGLSVGAESKVASYEIVSRAPAPTADQLRSTARAYPGWVRENYLQIPDTVPLRVRDLAQEVAGQAETPYDAMVDLTNYLRTTFPYSLEAPPPPPGQDVVDFFLFDAQAGYCDYYASAFVVMARSLGVPARLAIGYATGDYDDSLDAFVVRADDAHSWPEVFFPGYGWIEFEPTAALNRFERTSEENSRDFEPLPTPAALGQGGKGLPWRQWGFGALLALFLAGLVTLAWHVWHQRRLASLSTPALVVILYEQLGQGGGRLGLSPLPSQTPHEYALSLSQHLSARAGRARWRREAWQRLAADAERTAHQLVDLYTRRRYASDTLTHVDRQTALEAWRSLRKGLWLFQIQR